MLCTGRILKLLGKAGPGLPLRLCRQAARRPPRRTSFATTTARKGTSPAQNRSLYDMPRLYESVFSNRDLDAEVEFLLKIYGREAPGRGPPSVCDLGCGAGQHAALLAQRGCRVLALDSNKVMLEYAKQSAGDMGQIFWLLSDMRDFVVAETVDMAMCLLGGFSHLLSNDDAANCLKHVAASIRPGGLFVVELAHPSDIFDGSLLAGDVWDAEDDGKQLLVSYGSEDDHFDGVTQVLYRSVLVERVDPETSKSETLCTEIVPQRVFTVQEMELLAAAAGLQTVARFGELNVDVALDDEEAFRHVLVMRKPERN